MKGFLFWGFWAGAHWRGADAALVNQDFTLNAAGREYQTLRQQWSTTVSGTADSQGRMNFRGFHGDYEVTVRPVGGQPVTQWLRVREGEGEQVSELSLQLPPLPRFTKLQPLAPKFALGWEPLSQAEACKVQVSSNLMVWTDLSPALSPLAQSWVDQPPDGASERFYRVLPTTNVPVLFDRDFTGSTDGRVTYGINAAGLGVAVSSGSVRQVYFWFSAPDLRNGVLTLAEASGLASPGGGPPGVLVFQMATKPTVRSGGADYWGFILPGFSLDGLPLNAVSVADLTKAQLQFRYRLTAGRTLNVRLESTAPGGGYETRCDFGNLTGNGNWQPFSMKLSQGSNLTAFRNFLTSTKSAALQIVIGNAGALSTYASGDTLQLDDILVSYTP